MSAPARLLVFDLDGTLVDSTRDLATATNAALRQVAPDREPLPVETVQAFVGNGARVLIEKTLDHAGVEMSPDEVLPVFLECYERCRDLSREIGDRLIEAIFSISMPVSIPICPAMKARSSVEILPEAPLIKGHPPVPPKAVSK